MIVVCGEALVDLVPADAAPLWRAVHGGGPANTAIALARLGTPTALACRLSGDAFGRGLRAHLRDNGVDLRLAVAATEPTTLAVVSLDAAGGAAYQFYVNGTADWQWADDELPRLPADTRAVHIGSLASVLAPGADVLRDWITAHRAETTVVYDPNVRPALLADRDAYRRRVTAWLDVAHVVKTSRDDLAWLHPGADPVDVARSWTDRHDVALVLVTLGADGAVAVPRDGDAVTVPGRRVPVVDTIGAGDTFCAGFLHWFDARGRPYSDTAGDAALRGALRFAVAAAALACTRRGAEPPTLPEVEALLAAG